MPFPLRRTLDPATEPIDVVTMKNYLRVDISDDDDLIGSLISVARERAEDMTGMCLLPQQWTFSFDRFPRHCYESFAGLATDRLYLHEHRRNSMFMHDGNAIILPRGPVQSVDSITYKDAFGDVQTLDPSRYQVDSLSSPARINPVYGTTWPIALPDQNSITVMFTAGCDSIPQSFIHAIKLIVGTYYENRAEVVQGSGNFNSLPLPLSATSLLATYEMLKLGYPRS